MIRVAMGGQELLLNGAGTRTRLAFKVYVASLYVPQKTTDPAVVMTSAPRRVQLNLLRTLTPDQLVDALVQGLKENNTAQEMTALAVPTGELVTIMKSFPAVKEATS
jgi:long-chain acyl-CoA synthetase